MPRDDARAAAGIDDPKLFSALVEALADRIAADGTVLRLAAHRITFSPEHRAARDRLIATLAAAGMAPPPLAELKGAYGASLVDALADGGEIVKIGGDFALAREVYERAKAAIAAIINAEGPATASRLREVLGTSRKYLIPLLEHLDAAGFTKRRGDLRELEDAP
jgi:selenocysteine-specific elongation factor